MVALSDETGGRLSCIHTSYRNMAVLSWVIFYLKSVVPFFAKYIKHNPLHVIAFF